MKSIKNRRLSILTITFSLALFAGCSDDEVDQSAAHSQLIEKNSQTDHSNFFDYKGLIWIDVLRGPLPKDIFAWLDNYIDLNNEEINTRTFAIKRILWKNLMKGITMDPITPPMPIAIENAEQIRYSADAMAFKEIINPQGGFFELNSRHRKLTVRIPFESNWKGVELPSNYSIQADFLKAQVKEFRTEDKIKSGDFQILGVGGTSYSIYLSFDNNEVCGHQAQMKLHYKPPHTRETFLLECHPGQNLTGSISITYNKDQEGHDLSNESQKKKFDVRFIE